jgi:hypothetical protein
MSFHYTFAKKTHFVTVALFVNDNLQTILYMYRYIYDPPLYQILLTFLAPCFINHYHWTKSKRQLPQGCHVDILVSAKNYLNKTIYFQHLMPPPPFQDPKASKASVSPSSHIYGSANMSLLIVGNYKHGNGMTSNSHTKFCEISQQVQKLKLRDWLDMMVI